MTKENEIPFDQRMRESESESLKRDLFRYLKYWKWIVFGAILALFISYVYLRYEPNVYSTNAKIKILKKKDSGMDLSGLTGNAPLFDMSTINLENEMEILLSRRIVGRVVDNLSLTTDYYTSGRIKTVVLYGSQIPFTVDWLEGEGNDLSSIKNFRFTYKRIDDDSFSLTIVDNPFNKTFKFGQDINIDGTHFVINPNPIYNFNKSNDNKEINFVHKNKKGVINKLISKIKVEPKEGSDVLELKINGQNTEKNEAILNNLIKVFNEDGIEDDRQVARKTAEFVSNRLDALERELDTVETNLVEFRRDSNFVSETGGTLFSTYSTAEQNRAELETQLEISKYVQEEIRKNSAYGLLPGEVGLQNASTNSLISEYNNVVLQRNALLTSSKESSPQVLELSKNLRLLRQNIQTSIENYINSLQISLRNMSVRERQFNSSIKAIPEKEKIAREIKRQQAVKENLYIFLLQKQVEADLSAAITAPTAKVVDYAFSGSTPISPKPSIVYLAGLVIGLAIPIGFLYLLYLFDTKVTSKEQIQAKLEIPIIAEIPVNKEYDNKIVKPTDNSNVAEAFRILRTNMGYLIPSDKDQGNNSKVIFSTSSTKGEGKTFTAINSASVFASNNHKTLLIGCDLRNPQLHNYLGVSKKNIGLSSYLVDPDLKLNDVIFNTEKDLEFDIILSGEIPPNPSELLNNGRLEEIIAEAREVYDYIIVDTAPTMLVTDTLTIIDNADAVIYMIRANFTELKILRHIRDLSRFNMKKNIGIAINAVDEKKGYEYNYGYGYGYGVDTKVKKWYQF